MAQVDCTIFDVEYNQMMTVLDAMRAKLATLKAPLTKIMQMDNGEQKIKAFAQTDDGRLLREVNALRNNMNKFFEDIGWD